MNSRKQGIALFLAAAVVAISTAGVQAAPITDVSTFTAVTHQFIDFDHDGAGAPFPSGGIVLDSAEYIAKGVTVVAPAATQQNPFPQISLVRDNDACFRDSIQALLGGSTPYGLRTLPTELIGFDFNPPVSAFGFFVEGIDGRSPTFTARDVNDNIIESIALDEFNRDGVGCGFIQYGFVGISSTTPIYHITITYPSQPGGIIDNMRFKQILDTDGDGIADNVDNCVSTPNNNQLDTNSDGQGDACDDDDDGDGFLDGADNCPLIANSGQENADGDGLGDVCDACPLDANNDSDGDGHCGNVDNCPSIANSNQANADGDGLGDVCDACPNDAANDSDLDGHCGDVDNCPTAANGDQANNDGDLVGDVCDPDDDNDGLSDVDEAAHLTDPFNPDTDGDGLTDNAEVIQAAGGACPDPLNADSDGDGDFDGAEITGGFSPCNARPTAHACVEQLTNIGGALVKLDGSGSTDSDDAQPTLIFKWTVDASVVANGTGTANMAPQVLLAYGTHNVTLRVTDPAGGWDEATKTITLNPASLSVFEIDNARVRFGPNPHEFQVNGEIGLPFGTNYAEVDPQATLTVALGGVNAVSNTSVTFVESGQQSDKWDLAGPVGNLTKFSIDWKGARFKYQHSCFPIAMQSEVISSDETVLNVDFKKNQIGGAFSIHFAGQAAVNVSADYLTVTATGATVEVDTPKKKFTVTLPFALLESSTITVSGAVSQSIDVGDYLKASVGRYKIAGTFPVNMLPGQAATTPRTVNVAVTIGAEAYPGAASLGAADLEVVGNRWRKGAD